jgi:MFS family permease
MGLLGAAFGVGFIVGPVIGGLASAVDLSMLLNNDALFHPFSFCAFLSFILSMLAALRNYTSLVETLPDGTKASPRSFLQLAGSVDSSIHKIVFVNFLYLLMFAGYEFTVTFFYKIDFNLSPMQIGLIFFYIGLLIAAGQGGLVRALSRRYPERKLVLAGIALVPLALIAFAKSAPSVWLSLLLIIPITIGTSLFQPSITALASLSADAGKQGLVMGYVRSAGSLSRALGPIIGATLYWAYGVFVTYTVLALIMVVAFFLMLGLKDIRKIDPAA